MSKKNKNNDWVTMVIPYAPKPVGVLIDIQHTNKEIILTDSEEEYQIRLDEIKKKYGDNCIVVKKIIGVIIPVKTDSL